MLHQLNTEIAINAPVQCVWQLLMDFQNYNQWNPFIRQIEGDPWVNGNLRVTIQHTVHRQTSFKAKVLSCRENQELSWQGKFLFRGLFDGLHQFKLEAIADNATIFKQSEQFSGLLVKYFIEELEGITEQNFARMNLALKDKAEAIAAR
ncbi:SRPBCC domain-containing protein [Acinetobacter larvae]|uniref:Polyketide cyclase n=1 Tax=Acinetobacter larvae TaxID=1789224 RepID=A0A1B2M2L9_9GAMM|nr:SRPBCC domain-containing protein [Acinetobacter larvae]AOA59432.1 hypothetical protein BFG52_14445 [Acinetobacter larvae]